MAIQAKDAVVVGLVKLGILLGIVVLTLGGIFKNDLAIILGSVVATFLWIKDRGYYDLGCRLYQIEGREVDEKKDSH